MKNKFKKGLILGGILAAGAALGFVMNKNSEQLTEELQKDLGTLAKHLKKNLSQLQDVTKENFYALVSTSVEEYAQTKELTSQAKKTLITALNAKWIEMENEYLAVKKEKSIKKR